MWKLVFLFVVIFSSTGAQVFDDFSDGDFTSNPEWFGDLPEFEISNSSAIPQEMKPALKLNSSGSDTSMMYLPNAMMENTEWNFWVKLSFNTSDNNNARVYLVSDQQNLKGSLNGYYVQVGGSNDSIALFKQTGLLSEKIISGSNGYTGNSTNVLRIKVTRENNGEWALFSDITGGNNFQPDGFVFDNSFLSTAYFGIFCKYTSSNSTKFYFDDFYVNEIQVDTIPPEVVSVTAVSNNQLDIGFNETPEDVSVENVLNYFVGSGYGNPASAVRDNLDNTIVHLGFTGSFVPDQSYTIIIKDIQDNAGNVMPADTLTFIYSPSYPPDIYEIVINEIMADPNPPRGLPEYEFVELYNTTDKNIILQNCGFFIGTTEKLIPDVVIGPYGYLILTKEEAVPLFSSFGTAVGFSSFTLPNSGQTLMLKTEIGVLISEVTYSDDWYQDSDKADGGWTLEQIDPYNPCLLGENWIASNEDAGGTPGAINSVDADNPSNPEISKVLPNNINSLNVFFNEVMDGQMILNPDAYYVSPFIGNPSVVVINPDALNSVVLAFADPFQTKTLYTLTISDTIENCIGNYIPFNFTYTFGISEPPEKGDVIINEVLFNPADDGVDFVEIVNISDKIINPGDLKLGSIDENQFEPNDTIYKGISDEWGLMLPETYIVLTKDPDKVKSRYFTENPEGFIRMSSFPSYSNDEGSVILSGKYDNLIDAFDYSEDMQFPLLNSVDGVSLERIGFKRPTYDGTNWHSAAESVGYATPAYQNSQFNEGGSTEDPVSVEPEIFSPDNDGYNDVLNIIYKFDSPGYTASITIYDSQGRLTRTLVQNVLLGTEGSFSWDGLTDDNQKASIGIYIVFFEAFDLNGNVNRYKKTVVLGAHL
jgi:hypothetical protein